MPKIVEKRTLVLPPISIVVLYIVLGTLNRFAPWGKALADPAAKTLLLNVRMLHVSVGTVPQQPSCHVWRGESGPLTFVKDAVRLGGFGRAQQHMNCFMCVRPKRASHVSQEQVSPGNNLCITKNHNSSWSALWDDVRTMSNKQQSQIVLRPITALN